MTIYVHKLNQQHLFKEQAMNKVLMLNLAFWATAIAFPIVIHLLPTSTGEMPKFFEFLVPLFQVMLACGATYLVKTLIEKKPSN